MANSIEDLERLILEWSGNRGILDQSTMESQYKKLCEEVSELGLAIGAKDRVEIFDGIGDSIVVLINLAALFNTDLRECLLMAWGQIRDRRGKMVNGIFVKEE